MCLLSLAWGIPQSDIETSVSARDVDEMARLFRDEPWGPWRDNLHAGLIASTMANAFRGKDTKPYSYEDFMLMSPDESRERREQKQRAARVALVASLKAAAKGKNG